MKKRILACLLTLLMVVSMIPAFGLTTLAATEARTMTQLAAGSDAVHNERITIASAAELGLLSDYVNAGRNSVYVTFELLADITLNEGTFGANGAWYADGSATPSTETPDAFAPIGTMGTPFAGTFSGNGHTVNGLYIDSTNNNVGLFGYVSSIARIQDLTISNSYVSGSTYTGAVVGLAAAGAGTPVIDNCVNNGYVVGKDGAVGGILGGSFGVTVRNCTNNGEVSSLASAAFSIGGIVGRLSGDVINSVNTALVGNSIYQAYVGGIVGTHASGKIENNVNYGPTFRKTGGVVGSSADTAKIKGNYYELGMANYGIGSETDVASATARKSSIQMSSTAMLQILNEYVGKNMDHCHAWIFAENSIRPALSSATPTISISAGNKLYAAATLTDALYTAGSNANSTVKLLDSVTVDGAELGGTYTLDLNGKTITASKPLTVSTGTVTVTDSVGNGKITCDNGSALVLQGGSAKINAGSFVSTTTYAVTNNGTKMLYLSGKPSFSGVGASIYLGYANTLSGNDGAESNPKSYEGGNVTISCGWQLDDGSVIAQNAPEGKFYPQYDTSKYATEIVDGSLTLKKIFFGSWWFVGAMLALAAGVLIFTLIRTAQFKRRLNSINVLAFLPLALVTTRQTVALIIAGVALLASVAYCVISLVTQNKKLKAAKATPKKAEPAKQEPIVAKEEPVVAAPVEEAPVEEAPAEEAPVEEAPVEEAPVEEAPVEEAPVEEAPVEEAPAEEAPVEEAPVEEAPVAAPKLNRVVVPETDANGNVIYSNYKKSFTARMIQSSEDVQERYETLKNALLSYKKVSSRVSWSYDSFKSGKKQLAKFAIRGKTLCLFLALDPSTLETSKYNITNVSDSKKYSNVPCRLRLTSKRSVKWGLELIAQLAENEGLAANPKFKAKTYKSAYISDEELLEQNLIKKVQ